MDWAVVAKFGGLVVAMLNPVGNLPVFLSETSSDEPRSRRKVSLLLAIALWVSLVLVFLGGHGVLAFFGVSLSAFMIAGGLLLLMFGLKQINNSASVVEPRPHENPTPGARFRDLLVPVCIPLYVGPGTISTCVVYSQQADNVVMKFAMVGALLLASALVGATFIGGGLVKHILGETGLVVVGRLMGLVLAGVGVELLLKGISGAFPGVLG